MLDNAAVRLQQHLLLMMATMQTNALQLLSLGVRRLLISDMLPVATRFRCMLHS